MTELTVLPEASLPRLDPLSASKTPHDIKAPKGLREAPPKGWEEETWYLVNVAYSSCNVIHRAFFFTGFLTDGEPAGYNQIVNPGYDENKQFREAFYLKPVMRISSEYELGMGDA